MGSDGRCCNAGRSRRSASRCAGAHCVKRTGADPGWIAPQYFTTALGKDHGNQVAVRCRQLGIAAGATIYFCVDYDATGDEAASIVVDYFKGVRDGLANSCTVAYKVGIYGTRNVCRIIMDANLADSCWVAGLSTGYSGNLGFPMPEGWALNQIYEDYNLNIDHDAVSVNARPLGRSDVAVIPESSGGFDQFYWSMVSEAVRAEAHTRRFPLVPASYAAELVLAWLRSVNYAGKLWAGFIPPAELEVGGSLGEALGTARASYISESRSPSTMDSTYEGGDVQHMGATADGVRRYGRHALSSSPGLGDFGGWALDAVQLWVNCYDSIASQPNPDIASWVSLNAFEASVSTGFARADLWADVDGYLLGGWLNDGDSLSEAVRKLQLAGAYPQRLTKFLVSRFGSDFTSAIPPIITTIFAAPWPGTWAREDFLGKRPTPTASQAVAFGNGLAMKLAQIAAG